MKAKAIQVKYIGARGATVPGPWLAQIESDDGKSIETLGSDHDTEKLALAAARREIARRG